MRPGSAGKKKLKLSSAFVIALLAVLLGELLVIFVLQQGEGNEEETSPKHDTVALLPPDNTRTSRLAVIVAGTFQRFFFQSTVEHVIAPLARKGHQVDYFAFLTTNIAPPYRKDFAYTEYLHWDPALHSSVGDTGGAGQVNFDLVRAKMTQEIQDNGGTLRTLVLKKSANIEDDELITTHRSDAKAKYPDEDPDLRFPILDLRETAKQKTANANRNLLNLHYTVQELWNDVLAAEASQGVKYDHVLFLRDDTYWLADFNLDRLTAACSGDAFVLSCDAREPRLYPEEVNDHALLVARDQADRFGKYYSTLFSVDYEACAQRAYLEETDRKRGCNSEMILKWVLDQSSLSVCKMPQSLIPFERSAHVRLPSSTSDSSTDVITCMHKFCQSNDAPLQIPSDLQMCRDLKF